jgi:hypothetical protein
MATTADERIQAGKVRDAETIMAMICELFMELSSDLSREQEERISEIEEHLLRAPRRATKSLPRSAYN